MGEGPFAANQPPHSSGSVLPSLREPFDKAFVHREVFLPVKQRMARTVPGLLRTS